MSHKRHWLDRERLTVYPRIVLGLMVFIALIWVLMSKDMVDPKGKPLGYDFITFWAASHIALNELPETAYDIFLLFQAEKLAVPASKSVFAWYYPPSFYLLIWPLALLPYLTAYWLFMLSTLAGYWLVLRRVIASPQARWCLAAFPGIWMNLFHGQNAFLTAALVGGALLCLPRRPVLAGVFIGLMAIKPHLAILFPVALLAIGAWRTIFVAALTSTLFMSLGTALLGVATLKASLGSLEFARHFLEQGILPWAKMPTIFAFLRLLGTPVSVAYGAHLLAALVAVIAMWQIWRRSQDWSLRSSALMLATFLCSPYVFDYDLAWLALPIAWQVQVALRDGWLRGERELLVTAWALPLLMNGIASWLNFQLAPFVLMALLGLVWYRAVCLPRRHANTSPPAFPHPL